MPFGGIMCTKRSVVHVVKVNRIVQQQMKGLPSFTYSHIVSFGTILV